MTFYVYIAIVKMAEGGDGMSEVVDVIGNVGFPIAFCIMMWYQMNRQQTQYSNDLKELSKTIENNTNAMNNLITMLKGGVDSG